MRTNEMNISDIFTMSNMMRFAGYEGLPGGPEAIAKAEKQEHRNVCERCNNEAGPQDDLIESNLCEKCAKDVGDEIIAAYRR